MLLIIAINPASYVIFNAPTQASVLIYVLYVALIVRDMIQFSCVMGKNYSQVTYGLLYNISIKLYNPVIRIIITFQINTSAT